ncbi:MAG: DNA methyltransferase [Tepidisphaeraceae bacterium]
MVPKLAEVPLPMLANESEIPGCPRDIGWLDRLGRLRFDLAQRWRQRRPSDDDAQVRLVIDQALGLSLLVQFMRQERPSAIPVPSAQMAFANECTNRQMIQSFRQSMQSPILLAVLDAETFDDALAVPEDIQRSIFQLTLRTRLSLSSFGEFHQFCLSPPPSTANQARRSSGLRRARGIHYTPSFIVDYLTCRVLDSALNRFGDVRSLRLIDPSCGCGIFLVAAVRYLFRHELVGLSLDASPQERLDLLCHVIHGMDVDATALEWARRSLLLAVWQTLSDEHSNEPVIVPDLRANLTCGDFLLSNTSEMTVVLGGPPFVRIHELRKGAQEKLSHYRSRFLTARQGQFDLYMLFFEKAITCLTTGGLLGWSVSNTFLRSQTGRTLRQLISQTCTMREIIEFAARNLYPDAVTQIALTLLERGHVPQACRHVWIRGNNGLRQSLETLLSEDAPSAKNVEIKFLAPEVCSGTHWLLDRTEQNILPRMKDSGAPLAELPIRICQGVVTGADPVFLLRRLTRTERSPVIVSDRDGRQHVLEADLLIPIIRNRDVSGYQTPIPRTVCLTPYTPSGQLLTEDHLRDQYPRTYRYLLRNRDRLPAAAETASWFAFRSSAALRLPDAPRILVKRISAGHDSTLIGPDAKMICHSSVLVLVPDSDHVNPLFLLGILNSGTFWAFVRATMPTMGEGRHALRLHQLRQFPFPRQPAKLWPAECEQILAAVLLLTSSTDLQSPRQQHEIVDSCVARMYGLFPGAEPDSGEFKSHYLVNVSPDFAKRLE